MKIVYGDIISLATAGRLDVIVHGCNCHCTMGAGVAGAIKAAFPEAYDADRKTEGGCRAKLGTISVASVVRGARHITIVNGYTQFDWRGNGVKADYDAIHSVMNQVKYHFTGRRIGYPRIGAGLAGGNWNVISKIIDEALQGEDHTLVEYVKIS